MRICKIKQVNVIIKMIVSSCCHRRFMLIITHHSFLLGICHLKYFVYCLCFTNKMTQSISLPSPTSPGDVMLARPIDVPVVPCSSLLLESISAWPPQPF